MKNSTAPHGQDPPVDWSGIARSKPFQDLIALKRAFIVPAYVFFLLYYLALAVLLGYAPRLAATRVISTVNIAYLFALSQFVVGWVIAALYLMAASKFDKLADDVLAILEKQRGSQ
ncbi:MAG TPA: DUF485 domain-containing protein [Terriglobales bacterium]|nr:DUF485 domain-containing protein [Terriglobales bacterium]